MSCFCPAIVVGGNDVAHVLLFNKLLCAILEESWARWSEVEACRAEYQSFEQEQWKLERSSTRIRPDVGDVLSFRSIKAGFRAHQYLYKVCIVSNHACCFTVSLVVCSAHEIMMFQVFQLTALVMRGPATRSHNFIFSYDRVAIREEEVRGVLLCVQDFVRSPHFTQRRFFS